MCVQLLVRYVSPVFYWRNAAVPAGWSGTRAVKARPSILGWEVDIRIEAPATIAQLETRTDALATAFGIRRVRVVAHETRSHMATVHLDIHSSVASSPYPAQQRPVWLPNPGGFPVPFGIDDHGQPVSIQLHGASMLIGGNPGAGKSTALRTLLAGLASQQDTMLVGIDPKRVELTPWAPRFTKLVVGNEAEPTLDLLRSLVEEVQRRARVLAERGLMKAPVDGDMPSLVLIVDEWAEMAADGDKKQREEAAALLRRYVSLGRAVGCSAVLATQRPTSDTVDPGTRALLAYRFAMRCGDKWQSEAILGAGRHEATSISYSSPGHGYLSATGPLIGVQTFELDAELIQDFLCPVLRVESPAIG